MLNNINDLVLHYDGEIYNLIYKVIGESGDLSADYQFICENLVKDQTDRTVAIEQVISADEYTQTVMIYKESIEGMLTAVLKSAILGMIPEADFYGLLCRKFRRAFDNDKELAVALTKVLEDDRIPFIYLGKPLSMDNEEYRKYVDKNREYINKIYYALRADYSQKTEVSSVLLNIIDSVDGYEDKVVVLSQLLNALTKDRLSTLKDLLDKLQETE